MHVCVIRLRVRLRGRRGPVKLNSVTFRLIRHADQLIVHPPEKIVYCYGEFQPSFAEFPQVEFHEGLPDVSRFDGKFRILLIIDDLMNEAN
jgi:hypothetical protein